MSFQYRCGKTFAEIFDTFHVSPTRRTKLIDSLQREGYTERGICYAANRAEEKLLRFLGDSRFDSIFINEVRKYAFKPGDPKWNNTTK